MPLTTKQAAERLGIPYTRLCSLIRYSKLRTPAKTASGDYAWTDADLAAAQAALQNSASRTSPAA